MPELVRGLGVGLKEWKKATSEIKDEVQNAAENVNNSGTTPKA